MTNMDLILDLRAQLNCLEFSKDKKLALLEELVEFLSWEIGKKSSDCSKSSNWIDSLINLWESSSSDVTIAFQRVNEAEGQLAQVLVDKEREIDEVKLSLNSEIVDLKSKLYDSLIYGIDQKYEPFTVLNRIR